MKKPIGMRTTIGAAKRLFVRQRIVPQLLSCSAAGSAYLRNWISATGTSPLIGTGDTGAGDTGAGDGGPGDERFVDLCDLYSSRIRSAVTAELGPVPEGVYAGLVGPQFETPAEIRALAAMGADLVGMSTVLEAIAAAHLGAEVAGVSLVTNPAAGLTDRIDHREVLDSGARSLEHLVPVVAACIRAARPLERAD